MDCVGRGARSCGTCLYFAFAYVYECPEYGTRNDFGTCTRNEAVGDLTKYDDDWCWYWVPDMSKL